MVNDGAGADERNRSKQTVKPRVLIVDDNPQYARLFELLAEELGITTEIVSTCGEAMEIMRHQSADLVLMDWIMPEVNGPMCASRMRELDKERNRHTPIIGVSGYVKATKDGCIDAGMDDFLPVPFTIESLREKLANWLNKAEEPV